MKKKLPTILLIIIFCIGFFLLLYPTASDYWNVLHQSRVISDYIGTVAEMNVDIYEQIWEKAEEYNRSLLQKTDSFHPDLQSHAMYEECLDVTGSGMMGYLEIPSIDVRLPIYHGTEEGVLQIAAGHMEGSSLPVGGENSHCVLSGHRGLPSAKLFTNLDQLVEGDTFILRVLNTVLTYEVDQILIVEPDDLSALELEEGQDYCTLVTCTPYGVNTHRLLVRGHRVENAETTENIRVKADALQVEPVRVAPLIAVPMLMILLIWLLVKTRRKKE